MGSNIKTIFSITEDNNTLECTYCTPIEVAESLSEVFGDETHGDKLLRIVSLALGLHFATEKAPANDLDAFIAKLRDHTEAVRLVLGQFENQTEEE